MRLVRCTYGARRYWGVLEAARVRLLEGDPYGKLAFLRKTVSLRDVALSVPATPTKIVLVGLNYKDHAKELGMRTPREPVIFLKPVTSLAACGCDIVYPKAASRLDYEAELALVIKKTARHVRPKETGNYILGYTCLNDVTARDLQKKDGQWTRAKSFDTFCPVGPWVETALDASSVAIASYVNGAVRQRSSTSEFIFTIPRLVSFISGIMTLLPGDIISTGTPAGVGPLRPGDIVEVKIEGIGCLENRVVAENPKKELQDGFGCDKI
ncbi:MAG TPA: fumarylacetoacetate hydrolase family protein [Patescibacteria group bacterium]|nr:fumarylacetoacetate hydrolase family protein [Patescibacteria group bacterium]